MSEESLAALRAPSQHPMPDDIPDAGAWRLRVDGLVERPLALTLEELRALPVGAHQGSYTCERGWAAGARRWSGPDLGAVLALARPLPEASAFYAEAAGFRSLVPLEATAGALLALELDGRALSPERGAPCRLVVTDPAAPLSLKWVERLELFRRAPEQPAGPPKPG